jgi:hypothetical protein
MTLDPTDSVCDELGKKAMKPLKKTINQNLLYCRFRILEN